MVPTITTFFLTSGNSACQMYYLPLLFLKDCCLRTMPGVGMGAWNRNDQLNYSVLPEWNIQKLTIILRKWGKHQHGKKDTQLWKEGAHNYIWPESAEIPHGGIQNWTVSFVSLYVYLLREDPWIFLEVFLSSLSLCLQPSPLTVCFSAYTFMSIPWSLVPHHCSYISQEMSLA